MAKKMLTPVLNNCPASREQKFRDAAEAYEYFTGTTLTADDTADSLWYVRLQNRMVAHRKATVGNQVDVAARMGTSQSEVSRLENGLGPGTRLGTLRGYLAACETSLEELLASLGDAADAEDQNDQERDFEESTRRLVIEGHEFIGTEAKGVLEALQALNNLLRQSSISRAERKAFILAFLHGLAQVRSGLSTHPSQDFDVHVSGPDEVTLPVVEGIKVAGKGSGLSAADFRKEIAEPLNLIDF